MSEVESLINIPVEHCSNIFGQFDEYAKVIEKTLKVTIIVRDSSVKAPALRFPAAISFSAMFDAAEYCIRSPRTGF